MERLGATWEDRDLCCADFGVPTTRKRLWGVAHFDGVTAYWGPQTNAHRSTEAVKSGALLPHVPAASFIDWSLPLPSIFDRKKDLAPATLKRVAVGMKRFVLEAEKPFLIHLTHHGERPGMDVGEAGPTFTGAHRGEMAVVAPHVTKFRKGAVGHGVDEAIHTMTCSHSDYHPGGAPPFGIVGAVIQAAHGEGKPGGAQRWGHGSTDVQDALGTATASNSHAVMAATVIGAGGRAAQTPPIDVAGALNTSTTKEDRCVVAAHLTRYHGERRPGEARGVDLPDSLPTQTTENRFGVVGAYMVQHNTGLVGHDAEDGLSTVTTLGTQQQVAGAYLIHQRGTSTAADAEGAVPALTTGGGKGGDHIGICAPYLTEYYGTGGQHCGAEDALNTLSTADRFAVTGAALAYGLTPAQYARARQVAEFLRAHGVWNGGEIVTFGPWIVVDIGMRMLRPEEAAAAHELRMPDLIRVRKRDRKGAPVLDDDGNEVWVERPLTKTEAMRLIGNSVPKRMARLLVEWNARRALGPVMEAAE
jgi:DNA (cytosine-5)-methyltransferase 1